MGQNIGAAGARPATILCMLILAAVPAAAGAQDRGEWYVSGAGTISMLESTEGTIANAPFPGSSIRTQNEFGTGWGAQAALGYDFGRFRTELEVGFNKDTQDDYVAIAPPTGRLPADVEEDSIRAMLNAYVDIMDGPIQPYLGAGIGMTRIDLVFIGPRAPFPTEAPRELINDHDNRFAYQLMAGVAFALNDRVALTGQYRWLDAGTFRGLDSRGEPITRDHAGHHIDFGVRLSF